MSLNDELDAVRRQVSAGVATGAVPGVLGPTDDGEGSDSSDAGSGGGGSAGSGPAGVASADVESALVVVDLDRGVDDELTLVTLEPRERLTVADLESTLGPARELPRTRPGAVRPVIFPSTVPAEGATGATVLAEVEGEAVRRILVRRDVMPA